MSNQNIKLTGQTAHIEAESPVPGSRYRPHGRDLIQRYASERKHRLQNQARPSAMTEANASQIASAGQPSAVQSMLAQYRAERLNRRRANNTPPIAPVDQSAATGPAKLNRPAEPPTGVPFDGEDALLVATCRSGGIDAADPSNDMPSNDSSSNAPADKPAQYPAAAPHAGNSAAPVPAATDSKPDPETGIWVHVETQNASRFRELVQTARSVDDQQQNTNAASGPRAPQPQTDPLPDRAQDSATPGAEGQTAVPTAIDAPTVAAMPAENGVNTATLAASQEASPDLHLLPELGEGMRRKLVSIGVTDLATLAASNPKHLRRELGALSKLANVESWIGQAQNHLANQG